MRAPIPLPTSPLKGRSGSPPLQGEGEGRDGGRVVNANSANPFALAESVDQKIRERW